MYLLVKYERTIRRSKMTIQTILATFREYPDALKIYGGNISEVEGKLRGIDVEEIDVIQLEKMKRKSELSTILAQLPGDVIATKFGADVLIWIWINYVQSRRIRNKLQEDIELYAGMDGESLQHAQVLEAIVSGEVAYEHILQNYKLIEARKKGELDREQLKEMLLRARKENEERRLNEKTANAYTISFAEPNIMRNHSWDKVWKHQQRENRLYEIYLDGAFGFILHYQNEPVAVCTYDTTKARSAIIKQLQGVKPEIVGEKKSDDKKVRGETWALAPLGWTQFFVEYTTAYLQQFGFDEIGILGARNNSWIKRGKKSGKHRIEIDFAERRYDATAQRLGFEQREDGDWYKKIHP